MREHRTLFLIDPPTIMAAGSRVFQYRLANFSIGRAYGDSSGPVFPGRVRAFELHPGRQAVPRDAAFAHASDPASGEGVRWISVRPAPLEGSADRTRQDRAALPAGSLGAGAGREEGGPGPRGEGADAVEPGDHVHHRPRAADPDVRPLPQRATRYQARFDRWHGAVDRGAADRLQG